ncbi:hypothetical protein AAH994_15430 [Weeksellaceae bacterium A-14]
MPLNKVFSIIFSIFFSLKIYATEQFPTILKFNGKKYEWKTSSPAYKYFKENDLKPPKEAIETSANVDYFIYEYEIIDNKLYLSDVKILVEDSNKKLNTKSVFNLYFPRETKFLMSDFSKIFFIPYGEQKLIEYKKEDWSEYYYQNYLVFQIEKGIVQKNYDFNYNELKKFQKKQFRKFKKTSEYKTSLIKEKKDYEFYNEMRPENLQVSFDEYLQFKIFNLIKEIK